MSFRAPHAHYRSPWPNSAHTLSILNDRRIEHYLLRGFYGKDAQQRAAARAEKKAKAKRRRSCAPGDESTMAVSRINLDLEGLY